MIEIAVADQNDQLLEANLDGTTFYIHLAWNESGQFFTIGLQTTEGSTLIEGVVMVANVPLFYRLRHSFMPLGDLMVITDRGNEISRNSFIERNTHLVYLSEQDLKDSNVLDVYGRI